MFYGISQRGDIVTVTGTDRELEWNNGYGYWQLPWQQWLQGSTRKRPVTTAPAPGASAPATSHLPAHCRRGHGWPAYQVAADDCHKESPGSVALRSESG